MYLCIYSYVKDLIYSFASTILFLYEDSIGHLSFAADAQKSYITFEKI
jgi:hypothetical protein